MPVYVYKNLNTGEKFEVEQRITESAWTEHPESGDPVKRIIQPVGISFKGSGFYVNDSRARSEASGGAKAEGASGGEKSSGGEGAAPAASGGDGAKDAPKAEGGSKDSAKAKGAGEGAKKTPASGSGSKGD